MVGPEIIFIHNRAMDYRVRLFTILKDCFQDRLDFWFYHGGERYVPGQYYNCLDIRIRAFGRGIHRQFSGRCILALLKQKSSRVIVLNGANANYELPFLFLVALVKRKKIIFWTETWNWKRMSVEVSLFFRMNGVIAKHSDFVLYPGRKVKEVYDSLGIPEGRQVFIPDASRNSDVVQEGYVKTLLQGPRGRIRVVYLGRIIRRKGLEYLIRAMHILPSSKYELIVGGSGDVQYESECREMARGHPAIRFCGDVSKDRVNSFLGIVDVYVYPSANTDGMGEPWGLSINEAVALSKPCVATDMVGAAYDLIEGGKNGFIVRERDPYALASAIENAANLPRDVVWKKCSEKTHAYSYENMAAGFISAINAVQ